MGVTKKPRRQHRPRPANRMATATAFVRASTLTPAEREGILQPVRAACQALREGVATEGQWTVMRGTVVMAQAIETHGVVRGLAGHLAAASAALDAIQLRALASGRWTPVALRLDEVDALVEFVPLHEFQLRKLSEGELLRALDRAEGVVRATARTEPALEGAAC